MLIEVKVPQLSESVSEATLLAWHKKVGEAVKRDENLIDIETDKVVLELPAPADGVLTKIIKGDGGGARHAVGAKARRRKRHRHRFDRGKRPRRPRHERRCAWSNKRARAGGARYGEALLAPAVSSGERRADSREPPRAARADEPL